MCRELWRFWAAISVAAIICSSQTGCRPKPEEVAEKKIIEEIGIFADLSRALASTHEGLRDELARIADNNGTPLQLVSSRRSITSDGGDRQATAPDQSFAKLLPTLLSPFRTRMIESEARKFMPEKEFVFKRIDLENAIEFREDYDEEREQLRKALSNSTDGFQLDHRRGLLVDLTFTKSVQVYVWLEAIAAAEAIDDEKFGQAIDALSYMQAAISLLGREKHIVPRLISAQLRQDAMMVLARIAQHPRSTLAIRKQLYSLTVGQLSHWPDDADAWIGDRSLGLHTYEMIRAGHLLSVLSTEELDEFREDGSLTALARTLTKSIDDDEFFYLESMREIIKSCKKPFFERKETFIHILDRVETAGNQENYPMIADRVLLKDIEEGQRQQARDRALVEGWAIALALATGEKRPSGIVNPLTGIPYRVKTDPTRVVVSGIGGPRTDRRIELSLLAAPLNVPATPVTQQ